MSEFIVVSSNLAWLNEQKDKTLTPGDVQELIEHRDVFIKLLNSQALNYRIELMKDKESRSKDKNGVILSEDQILRSVDTCVETINTIASAHIAYQEYAKLQAEQSEEK